MSIETLEALTMEGLAFFDEIRQRAAKGDITPEFAAEALAALRLIERLQIEPEVLESMIDTFDNVVAAAQMAQELETKNLIKN